MRALCLIVFLLLQPVTAFAADTPTAPLPSGYVTNAQGAYVEGLFAHATFENWGRSAASERVINATVACRAKGRGLQVAGDSKAFGNEELWLYSTREQISLFVKRFDARIDMDACVAEPMEVREVHVFPATVSETAKWPPRFDGDPRSCHRNEKCTRKRVVGVPVRCFSMSARFVGSGQCVAIGGAARGMSLSDQFWQDDGVFADFKVTELRNAVRIDKGIFTSFQQWQTTTVAHQ